MERVAIIFNPNAGKDKLKQSIGTIVQKLLQSYREVTIYQTEKPGDGADYVDKIAENVDLLIAAGGDGTVNEIINALCALQNRPIFAIIPGGTSNDFSREIGISQNPLKATDQLLEQKVESVDVGKTNQQYFLNFWGIGLITEVSSAVDSDSKATLGRMAYYLRTAQTVSDVDPFHLQVESEDYQFNGESVMLIVGNGTFTGGIQPFFPNGDVQDGLLDVLLIKETSLQTFWSMIQSKMTPEISNENGMIYFQTKRLSVSANPTQEIDCDGESHYSTPTTISILPGHLRMLVGEYKTTKE
ncbi:diacylglycerol kinase [Virgibacillus phasianinus]|uniref:Diacylglycerol kinase n=1 Tax=Virgibacillus phasianinus TaxID=2017483 RepID=A0A220U1Z1_9BACI|nr:diacylglycerol kinase family protein [Virgibacillus phasianinus]ASK62264.1 diacylglycerol kinase [Virgibacillus phasianinus]